MPSWDDEYLVPYLGVGSVSPAGPLHGGAAARARVKKKVNTGFQVPGNEYPSKPKRKPRVDKKAVKRKPQVVKKRRTR